MARRKGRGNSPDNNQIDYFYGGGQGNIYYDNLGTIGDEPFWLAVRQSATNYFDQVELANMPSRAVGRDLLTLAAAERKKEVKMLKEFYGCEISFEDMTDGELIKAMNKALNLEPVFKRVAERLIDESQQYKLEDRSTSITKNYGSYLEVALGRLLIPYLDSAGFKKAISNSDYATIEEHWHDLVSQAMDKALDAMITARKENVGSTAADAEEQPWIQAMDAINQLTTFRDEFNKRFYSMYGFDEVKAATLDQWKQTKTLSAKGAVQSFSTQIRQHIKTNFGGKLTGDLSSSISGYIEEEFRKLAVAASSKDITFQMSTTKNSAFSTDSVVKLGEISSTIALEVDRASVANKVQAAKAFENFHKNMAAAQSKGTVVYESTKNYHLGEKFSGFHGTSFNVQSAIGMLNQIGYPHAEALLNKVKNTIPGSIYGAGGMEYRHRVSQNLAKYIAYFLFDDWTTIGDAGGDINVVHVFSLSSIVVPLSWLLQKMGQAMMKATEEMNIDSYVRIYYSLPKNLYSDKYEYENEEDRKPKSQERWSDQLNEGNRLTLHIHFLKNFKELIVGDLGAIMDF